MKIHIEAFKAGEMIPQEHTCDGQNTIPAITIINTPKETVSLALTVDDPDATIGSTWNHCAVYNIPPKTREITRENLETLQSGLNSWGNQWYSGPCPPKGTAAHRYIFTVYALSENLRFEQPPTIDTLLKTIQQHLIINTACTGMYKKST